MKTDKTLSELLMKIEEKYQDDPDIAQLSDLLAEDEGEELPPEDDEMGPDEDFEISPGIPMVDEEAAPEGDMDFSSLLAEDMGDEEELEPADEPVPVTGTNAKKKRKPLA